MLMAIANIRTRQADCTFTCGGAQVRAHCRHLATVVTVRGEIDAGNVERLGEHLRHFVVGDNPVVVDMSDVRRFAESGVSLLSMLDEQCRAAGVEWMLVTSPAVSDSLSGAPNGQRGDDAPAFPITGSVHEALHDLADAIASRRRLMLPFVRNTA
jgi:anti-anti-sigma factor